MTSPEPSSHAWGNTLRIGAEVLVSGGRTISGELHLQPLASSHSGPETPEDALNRPEPFFPLTSDRRTIFLAKQHVLVVAMVAPLPAEDPDRMSAARTLAMRIELSDGSELYGAVMSELPPDRPRVLDYLNSPGGFFALMGPTGTRFVNRGHIRLATPLD